MNVDPMKKAIVDVLVKENGLKFVDIDNSYFLEVNGITYYITSKGKIRYINPDKKEPLDFIDFQSNGDPMDTVIYLIKKYKQETEKALEV